MVRLLLICTLFFSLSSYGQEGYPTRIKKPHPQIQYVTAYGYEFQKLLVDTLFAPPSDTFAVPTALQNLPFLTRRGDSLYLWSIWDHKWNLHSGGGGLSDSRSISTTYPLQGGGDLTTDRTFNLDTSSGKWRSEAYYDTKFPTIGTVWLRAGNSGTSPSTDFIGTTDNVSLVFKVNSEKAGRIDNSPQNTMIGYQAGNSITSASNNSLYGFQAGFSITSSGNNVMNGYQAGYSTTNGTGKNVYVGVQSGYSATSARENVAVGFKALNANVSGFDNVAVGYQALLVNTGSTNTAVGKNALAVNTSGTGQTAVGNDALAFVGLGSYNTGIGLDALFAMTSGSSNTVVGSVSGYWQAAGIGVSPVEKADSSVYLGADITPVDSSVNQIIIGQGAEGLGSNTTVIGKSSTTLAKIFGANILDGNGDTLSTKAYVRSLVPAGSRFGVSGEDATAGQNRTFAAGAFRTIISGNNVSLDLNNSGNSATLASSGSSISASSPNVNIIATPMQISVRGLDSSIQMLGKSSNLYFYIDDNVGSQQYNFGDLSNAYNRTRLFMDDVLKTISLESNGARTQIKLDDVAQKIYLKEGSLSGASVGDVWKLQNTSTGEGAWVAPGYLKLTGTSTATGSIVLNMGAEAFVVNTTTTGEIGLQSVTTVSLGDYGGAGNSTNISISDGSSLITLNGNIALSTYGTGTHVGTSAYYLTVDASGNILEEAFPAPMAMLKSQETEILALKKQVAFLMDMVLGKKKQSNIVSK
jgi:hypothetical protein